jgi:hypothetical protein
LAAAELVTGAFLATTTDAIVFRTSRRSVWVPARGSLEKVDFFEWAKFFAQEERHFQTKLRRRKACSESFKGTPPHCNCRFSTVSLSLIELEARLQCKSAACLRLVLYSCCTAATQGCRRSIDPKQHSRQWAVLACCCLCSQQHQQHKLSECDLEALDWATCKVIVLPSV